VFHWACFQCRRFSHQRLSISSPGTPFEARNAEDEELEKEPVMKILQETSHLSCAEVIQEILRSVDDHSGSAPQEDDITVMLLRRNS
jgi:serine phosphatase RsbU (regulator of sigma subunit)